MPQPKHLNPIRMCNVCATEHEEVGSKCPNCGMCFKLCVRMDEPTPCRWYVASNSVIPLAAKDADGNVKDVSLPVFEDLEGAFKSWVASSTQLADGQLSPKELWLEFEMFAKERLQPVNSEKIYLHIDSSCDKFKMLDAKKLFRNQEGEYVLVENLKRIRIGKTVAVM